MADQRDPNVASVTVLDRVRPTVVKRRVYRAAELRPQNAPSPPVPIGYAPEGEDRDAAGPPSSVNVARAVSSLRGEELQRMEELLRKDDDTATVRAAAEAKPRASAAEPAGPPTLIIGRSIEVAELARRMRISATELVEALVKRGFFSATAKTSLSRASVRGVAESFGWRVGDEPAAVLLENMSAAHS